MLNDTTELLVVRPRDRRILGDVESFPSARGPDEQSELPEILVGELRQGKGAGLTVVRAGDQW